MIFLPTVLALTIVSPKPGETVPTFRQIMLEDGAK